MLQTIRKAIGEVRRQVLASAEIGLQERSSGETGVFVARWRGKASVALQKHSGKVVASRKRINPKKRTTKEETTTADNRFSKESGFSGCRKREGTLHAVGLSNWETETQERGNRGTKNCTTGRP